MSARRRALAAVLLTAAAIGVAGCSRAAESPAAPSGGDQAAAAPAGPAAELRLGYFPNLTHAAAIIGVDKGFIAAELGSTKLTTQQFNAGGDAVNALLGGSLDASFIGSGPAINAFSKSDGKAVRIIAGATDGGAQLVVRPTISSPDQLKGKVIAVPQVGNTQDIALRKWLKEVNLADGPDKAVVAALDNPRTLDSYKLGAVDGGWLPEPWASRLVDAGAKLLLDEKTRWPGGHFPTTVLVVRTDYLTQHPETVRALLRGELKAVDFINGNSAEAKTLVNDGVQKLTGKNLAPPVLDRAWADIHVSADPLASTFAQLSKDSVTAGVTEQETDVHGLFDLTALNTELQAAGKPAVDTAGLDKPKG
ncbi:MAG TPA: ABC transporter substrate-binding protein [Pseudonocardia sp.]|jgi:NitT/TauT family transport system substrate-binding protein|nr:ABC transporter substrate-binding protein [Pseudonocardia sp.]